MNPEQAAEITKDPWSMTLTEFVRMAAMFNGGITHMNLLRGEKPVVTVICVRGEQECAEIGEALASVERRWEIARELAKGEGGSND